MDHCPDLDDMELPFYQTRICSGNGECFIQDTVSDYAKNDDICFHNCEIEYCPNYEFCQQKYPKWFGWCHSGRCNYCNQKFHKQKLEFINDDDDCPVCHESTSRKMIFPACTHKFCLDCSRNILMWDESRWHIDPVPYGAPPCPHHDIGEESCRSRPCYLEKGESDEEDLDDRMVLWYRINPEARERWRDGEEYNLENNPDNLTYGNMTCPVCRKKVISPWL